MAEADDEAGVARFSALAEGWWDPAGPMRPLHRMNPLRVGWITRRVHRRFADLANVSLLDVGCGAGIAAEALARDGLKVFGIDASERLIAAARAHATARGLEIAYQSARPEDLVAAGRCFAVITALEVIEHVSNPARFIATLAALLAPGGLLFLSTLNRTARSLLIAKVGAEFLLRLLPLGTHDWRRFVTPSEMREYLAHSELRLADIAGMTFDPSRGVWRESRDLAINYIVMAAK